MVTHPFLSSRWKASLVALAVAACVASCAQEKPRVAPLPTDVQGRISAGMYPALRGTIGEFAKMVDDAPITVTGWGVVAGLPNTGSGDMDPKIRQLIMEQLLRADAGSFSKGLQDIDPERILSSNQVAAVQVYGVIPPLARKGSNFDLQINALPGSQTTSLANGLLWTTELKIVATIGNDTVTIAYGRGPVFISHPVQVAAAIKPEIPEEPGAATPAPPTTAPANAPTVAPAPRALRSGRVLGGGVCAEDRMCRFQLYAPNWMLTSAIERTINARFPGRDKVAIAESDSMVTIRIPADHAANPAAFVALVHHLYLTNDSPGFTESKAAELINALKDPNAPRAEISLALTGLGRSILPDYVQPQYVSADPVVRFWCARAGAGMQDVGGLLVLQETIRNPANPFRNQAINALVDASRGRDTVRATMSMADLLNSPNTQERIAAYQGLLSIRSRVITTYGVGRKFVIDVVPSDGPSLIYITQAESPRIAFIGRPLALPAGAIYMSPDYALTVSCQEADAAEAPPATQMVTASAVPGDKKADASANAKETVSLIYKNPAGGALVNLRTTPSIPAIVARLAWIPDPRARDFDPSTPYIGVTYQRISEMLATLCAEKQLAAQFVLQKAPAPILTTAEVINSGRPEGSTQAPATIEPTTQPAP